MHGELFHRLDDYERIDEREWRIWFYHQFPSLLPDRAAVLTHSFVDGMMETRKKAHEVLPNYVPPTLLITADPQQPDNWLSYFGDGNVVALSSRVLQWNTRLTPQESKSHYMQLQGKNEIVFQGRHDDLYRLSGVEEEDHALYEQRFGKHSSIQNLCSVSTREEYDAQPHELSALQMKLSVAEQRQMPKETINFFRNRLRIVEQYIRSHGMEKP